MPRSRHRRLRSHKLRAILILAVLIAGLSGATDLGYVTLKGRADQLQAQLTTQFEAAQQELEAGKASLTEANAKHDVKLVPEATAHFAAAKEAFLAAGNLADKSRLLHDLELLPSVGDIARSRHMAVHGVSEMGAAISDAGKDLAKLDGQLIQPPAPGPAGRTLLTALDQAHSGLITVRSDLKRAQEAAAPVNVQVLPASQQATFLKARDTIGAAVAGLDEFERLVPVLKDVFGGNGSRTYLVEQVNPAELRAGGGFIGTYSLIRADQGALTVIRSGDAYSLANPRPLPGQRGFIPQPSPLREVIPDISWSFVDSNIFPDFPSNAKAAINFAQPRIGANIDAVISMDYYTVAKMLDLTGPLSVPGYRLTVDGSNFVPQIVHADVSRDVAYKAVLSAIAGPLMERVSALGPDRWPGLLGALNGLASERHLQAYFNNDLIEQEINRVGWSGSVNPTLARDFMMEVESNYNGDKDNYFLTRQYTLELTRNAGLLHHKLTVDLVNHFTCGSYPLTSYGPDVRLYVSASESSATNNLRPVRYANPAAPAGTALLNGWQPDIQCGGGRGHAVFEYDTPWTVADRSLERIYWQKQPGTVNDKIDVTWNDGSGHNFGASGDLGQDRVITLSRIGVAISPGQPALATLPSLNIGY